MSTEDTIHKAFAAWARHDTEAFVATCAPDAVVHDPLYAAPLHGHAAIAKDMDDFLRAFPDLKSEIKVLVTKDDTYALEARLTGTNNGPLILPDGEAPPTGRAVEVQIGLFGRANAQGQIVEERRYYDVGSLVAQLGLTPAEVG